MRLFLGALVLFLATSMAGAVPLREGMRVPARPQDQPVGGEPLAMLNQPYVTANVWGSLVARVFRDDPGNPYGGLTFTYQLYTGGSSRAAIASFSVNGFTSYPVDVAYAPASGHVPPQTFWRDWSGAETGWSFDPPRLQQAGLALGASSDLLIIRTGAQAYTIRVGRVTTPAVSPINTFGPAGRLTPEPAGVLALLPLGRRQRRRV